jgi:hypothetical protein
MLWVADGRTAHTSPFTFGANEVSAPVVAVKDMTFVRGTEVPATWVEQLTGVAEVKEPTANIVLAICTSSSIFSVARATVAPCIDGAQAVGVADTIEVRLASVVVNGVVAEEESTTGITADPTATANTAPKSMVLERKPPRNMMSFRD